MRKPLLLILAGVLAACCPRSATANEWVTVLDGYSIESWVGEHELPFSRIWDITQDATGYLWLGTDVGLVRFDGTSFVRWAQYSGAHLRDGDVGQVLSASDGSLWVGFGEGGDVAQLRDGRVLQYFDERSCLRHGSMTFLLEDRAGVIWAGNRAGLYRIAEGQCDRVGAELGVPLGGAYTGYEDSEGSLWIATEEAVHRRPSDASMFAAVFRSARPVESMVELDGFLWVASADGVASMPLSGGVAEGPPPVGTGYDLLRDSKGVLWVATLDHGLWRRTPASGETTSRWNQLSVSDGLASNEVRSLYEDRAGTLWVGTVSALHRLTRHEVTPLTGMQGTRVVTATPDGSVWIGRINGLVRMVNGVAQNFDVKGVVGLTVDRDGTLWAVRAGGLLRWHRGQIVDMPLPPEPRLERVTSLGVDSHGTLWMCDIDHGVFVWRHGDLAPLSLPDDFVDAKPLFLYVDSLDRVWFGLRGGKLVMLDSNRQATAFEVGNSFGQVFMSVYEDRHKSLWVGGSHGLSRIRGGALETVSQRHGLPGHGVSAIVEDGHGSLWLGLSAGIARLSVAEFEEVLAGRSPRLRYELYDMSDGLAGLPRRYGFPSATRGTDGRIWFVTGSAVTIVDPTKLRREKEPIAVVVERAVADEERIDLRAASPLEPRVSRLLIEYGALNVSSPRKVHFRYRLDGIDEGWVDAGQRRTAAYTNLNAGTYRFRVVASSSDGAWNEREAGWAFTVAPAFSETWWPYGIACVVVTLGVWTSWRRRLRQVRHEFAMVVEERARISRELHDTLLQGVVGLTLQLDAAAQDLDGVADQAKERLVRIRRQAEAYVRDARQTIFDLRSATLQRRDLVEAIREVGERTVSAKGPPLELVVKGDPRRCPQRIGQQLLRIAQEAIMNAVRHSRAERIGLVLDYQEDNVVLRVADNGEGFEWCPDTVSPDHYGLLNMRERAQQVGGQLRIETAAGAGTVVEAIIPLYSRD